MPIVWRPQMSVGNDFVDNDHRYLLCLVNTVELALKQQEGYEDLRLALDQLVDYTHEHFAREEKLQIKVGYPEYANHKIQHQEILENVERLRQEMLDLVREPPPVARPEAPAEPPSEAAEESLSMDELEALIEGDAPDLEAVPDPRGGVDEQELVGLMRSWILDHVLQTDIKLKPYFRKYPSNLV